MKNTYTLEIILKSDLCAGNGENYAAVIDIDTALDELGLPFIPGKRIKGCLRDASSLVEIDKTTIDEIFGVIGSSTSGSLELQDAILPDRDNIAAYIQKEEIQRSDVVDIYCESRASTAIDDVTGGAKDESLRFFRVVSKNDIDEKPRKFVAKVLLDEKYENDFRNICKALRNIGYHRNRGLGSVECRLIKANKVNGFENIKFDNIASGNFCKLSILIRNDCDLMLPINMAEESMSYIPGSMLLGAVARAYVERFGENRFNEFFYSNDVVFSNLYISDKSGKQFFPSPKILCKIKGATAEQNKLYNILNITESNKRENTYKPLKKGFVCGNEYKDVKTTITYHNAIKNANSDVKLYMQECILKGQYFLGSIAGPKEKIQVVFELLRNMGSLSFGRSKTAQYGGCSIVFEELEKENDRKEKIMQNRKAAYILRSDVLLTDENGVNVCSIEEIEKTLGIECDKNYSIISFKKIAGYNGKRNMKNTSMVAFAAGSVIVFNPKNTSELPKCLRIGEKTNEGFGCIELVGNICEGETETNSKKIGQEENIIGVNSEIYKAYEKIKTENEILEKAINLTSQVNLKLNTSQIGRLIMMCKESEDFDSYNKCIKTIKSQDTKKAAEDINEKVDKIDSEQKLDIIITALNIYKYNKRGGEE